MVRKEVSTVPLEGSGPVKPGSVGVLHSARAVPLLLALSACGPDAPRSEALPPATLPVFVAADSPRLTIGVFEGDPELMFERVVDVLRLGGGEIAVADVQAARVSLFSPAGEPIRSWGGRGDGPGEFRSLSRLYQAPGDSLLALDARGGRASLFDEAGTYAREVPATELSGDSLFSMDVWLHRRFVVDGVLEPSERARVRAVLDRLPRPDGPGYRWVRAAPDGRLWIQEPAGPAPGLARWIVLGFDGRPERLVDLPDRLDADELSAEEVLGRFLGSSDVHFVRAYAIRDTDRTAARPAWLTGAPSAATDGAVPADFEAEVHAAVRRAAVAQEIHYSSHGRYTTRADSLDLEPEDGVVVHFWRADDRGWSGVAVHPAMESLCALGYGTATPPGWPGGTVVCGG
jgi:hypothetical protein